MDIPLGSFYQNQLGRGKAFAPEPTYLLNQNLLQTCFSKYLSGAKSKLALLKVLLVDNYDSFTYNLVDALRSLAVTDIQVVFHDQINWKQLDQYQKILISPGPGTPDEAGQLLPLIRDYHHSKSILGICLGHQAIAQCFDARLINLSKPRHGQTASIDVLSSDPLFTGLPNQILGGLYHSWSIEWGTLPQDLQVIANSGDRIMGIRHKHFDLAGLQFHPESFATPHGIDILRNWLND